MSTNLRPYFQPLNNRSIAEVAIGIMLPGQQYANEIISFDNFTVTIKSKVSKACQAKLFPMSTTYVPISTLTEISTKGD